MLFALPFSRLPVLGDLELNLNRKDMYNVPISRHNFFSFSSLILALNIFLGNKSFPGFCSISPFQLQTINISCLPSQANHDPISVTLIIFFI